MAQKTPLYEKHEALGGKIVEFAGWLLPVQYGEGIIAEHNAVRNAAGLFDVSHMGEIYIHGERAEIALGHLVTNSVATMTDGMCRYALMLYPDGGVVDDLLIYKVSDGHFLLVVNAANADKDYAWICNNLSDGAVAENISSSVAQLALQGPCARTIIEKLCDKTLLPEKNYRFTPRMKVAGYECLVSSTGYTGERGFEIYTAPENVVNIYDAILEAGKEYGIKPVGLGARDTLRFESCMTLYGHELRKDFKANETGVDFAVKKGLGFIGEDGLDDCPAYKRIGLKVVDKGIVREGCDLYLGDRKIGFVTSGMYCPTLGGAYAMARVESSFCESLVEADVRGRRIKVSVCDMPFYKKSN